MGRSSKSKALNTMRLMLHIIISILPWRFKRVVLNKFFGFQLHKTARIGLSVLDVRSLKMDAGSSFGHLNFVRSVNAIELQDSASVGNLNWITAAASHLPQKVPDGNSKPGTLFLGRHSALTNRHYIDCSGGMKIGNYSILAGVKSTFLTHSVDIYASRQKIQGIDIGSYCFLGTDCVLLLGAKLPCYSVLGAGSTLTRSFEKPYSLYAGSPAKGVKDLPSDSLFFTRKKGYVP